MEEIFVFLGFGLGASLGINLVRAVGRGLEPTARDIIRAGLAASDAVGTMAEQVRSSVAETAAEARDEAEHARNEVTAERPARRPRRSSELRKIEIAREE